MQQVSVECLVYLLTAETRPSRMFLSFLGKHELTTLHLINKHFFNLMSKTVTVQNQMFYQTFLNVDATCYFDFFADDKYRQLQIKKYSNVFHSGSLRLRQVLPNLLAAQSSLYWSLRNLVNETTATEIANDLMRSLKDPCLPLPKLRRESVGTYCQSSIQHLVAELNWSGRMEEEQEELYLDLKKEVFEQQATIVQYFEQNSHAFLLKKLRYQGQLHTHHSDTGNSFVNVISAVLALVDAYLDAVTEWVQVVSDTCYNIYDPLVEFQLRYCAFRNSLHQFQQKIGFVFVHFENTYQYTHPDYCIHPRFNIWRLMLKKWIIKSQHFHEYNSKICNYALSKQIESYMTNFLEQEHINNLNNLQYTLVDNQTQLAYFKASPPSCKYVQDNLRKGCSEEYFKDHHINELMSSYIEYLMDISINEYNVHWCGSSQQQIGTIYLQHQQTISDLNYTYMNYVQEVFGNVAVTKYALEHYLDFLNSVLKPCTVVKLNQQINHFLQDIKDMKGSMVVEMDVDEINQKDNITGKQKLEQQCINNWQLKVLDFSQIDDRLNFVNGQRQLTQQFEPVYRSFFNIDETVDLCVLQDLVRLSKEEEDWGTAKVQSYVSGASSKMEEEYDQS